MAMYQMIIGGIDPGANGAVAMLGEDGKFISVYSLSGDISETVAILNSSFREAMPSVVYVEEQHTRPTDGKRSAFTAGRNFGIILGVLEHMHISYEIATPQKWKGELGLIGDKNKAGALAMARSLWPEAPLARQMDNGRAEALLIARYGLLSC